MILVDHQIADLCRGKVPEELQFYYSSLWADIPRQCLPMVEPFDSGLINPASLDIRIGETAKLRIPEGYEDIDLHGFDADDPFEIYPGDRLLVASLETINLPNFLCAQFRLKSSRGREWYEHMEAGFCDPGWHGSKLTMEIINMDCESLPIYPGLKMGQLIFSLTLGIPDKDYSVTGRYNGDWQVETSKG
jgi:dCTP deaminase